MSDRLTVQDRLAARTAPAPQARTRPAWEPGTAPSQPNPPEPPRWDAGPQRPAAWNNQPGTADRSPGQTYNANPGVALGVASIIGGVFTAIPAIVMGVKGRKVAADGGSAPGATASLVLGILGCVWAGLLTISFLAMGAAVDESSFDSSPIPAADRDAGVDESAEATQPVEEAVVPSQAPAEEVAKIVQCDDHPNPFIGGRAIVELPANFDGFGMIEVEFLDSSGSLIDSGTGFAADGQTRVEVVSLSSEEAPASCNIRSVS